MSAITVTWSANKLDTCVVSGDTSLCAGVPVLFLGGVVAVGSSPALAFLGTATATTCNILSPGLYSTNPTSAQVQASVYVARISYTSNGPIHEIGTAASAINENTVGQPKVLNSKVSYTATATAGMLTSAGMYQGIYTLISTPAPKASYFIPTMGVRGTLVATYYLGTITSPDSNTDIDTLFTAGTLTRCFSGD